MTRVWHKPHLYKAVPLRVRLFNFKIATMANDSHSETITPLLSKASEDEKEPTKPAKAEKDEPPKVVLEFIDVGVWTVMREIKTMASWSLPTQATLQQGREMLAIFPIVFQFLQEVFSVSPSMMIIYLLSSFWSSTEVKLFIVHQ
jgi:hypothetical protein